MTATLPPMIRFQPLAAGAPIPGGKVYFYAAGTTTPQAAYAADGTTPLANPLTLDANGATDFRLGTGLAYKIDLKDAAGAGVTGWPIDLVTGSDGVLISLANASDATLGDALIGVKNPSTGGVARTQHQKNQDFVTPEDFGAKGDSNGTPGNGTDDTAAINAALATGRKVHLLAKTYRTTSAIIPCVGRFGTTLEGEASNNSLGDTGSVIYADHNDWAISGGPAAGITNTITGVKLKNLKILCDTTHGNGVGGVDMTGWNSQVLENIVVGPANGTTIMGGDAYRIASLAAGAIGGLYGKLRNCLASKATFGFRMLNASTNANVFEHCWASGCTTGAHVANNHNLFMYFDAEVCGDGIVVESAAAENIFFAPNFDGITGTAFNDPSSGSYLIAPHFAAVTGTTVAGLANGVNMDNVNGWKLAVKVYLEAMGADAFAEMFGPSNRTLRIKSRGNALTTGLELWSNNHSGTATQRLRVTDATSGGGSDDAIMQVLNTGLQIATVGKSIGIKEGSNAKMGVATLDVGGTVVVATTAVTSATRIMLTIQSPSGTVGSVYVSALSGSVSFTIQSTNTADRSVVAWMLVDAL